jgi:hypothetical protein
MDSNPQESKLTPGNVLQMRVCFTYNPNVLRNEATPGKDTPGGQKDEIQVGKLSEEKWE